MFQAQIINNTTKLKEVIKEFGFNKPGNDVQLNKETFVGRINLVLGKCKLFTEVDKSCPLFGINKNGNEVSVKQFMGAFNSLLKGFGLVVRSITKTTSKKVDGKWVSLNLYYYKFDFLDKLNHYL